MSEQMIEILIKGIWETLYMTVVSTAFAYLLGIPLGVVLYITDKNSICHNICMLCVFNDCFISAANKK